MNTYPRGCGAPWSFITRTNWLMIFTAGGVICVLSLGIHDVMLTKLKIPYPSSAAVPIWARCLDITARIASLVWVANIAGPVLRRISWKWAAALFGCCLMFLNETLRLYWIDISLTKGWRHGQWLFIFLDLLPNAIIWFFYGAVAATISRLLSTKREQLYANAAIVLSVAAATVATGMFVLQPGLERLVKQLQSFFHLSDPVQVYFDPYPTLVNWVIYGTFIEPTFAAFVLIVLIWDGLEGSSLHRICKYSILLLLIRGRFVSLLLFSFWVPGSRGLAYLSESQFFFETLSLGLLWGGVWMYINKTRSSCNR